MLCSSVYMYVYTDDWNCGIQNMTICYVIFLIMNWNSGVVLSTICILYGCMIINIRTFFYVMWWRACMEGFSSSHSTAHWRWSTGSAEQQYIGSIVEEKYKDKNNKIKSIDEGYNTIPYNFIVHTRWKITFDGENMHFEVRKRQDASSEY